ncbi:hypothetical protein HA49_15690 [Tatumella morbirosei]|uniref:Glycosyl transferase family 1 n=1 Tax=Tatumella morbirosei TaxID=642227 RepID=A0A095T6N1_9GAMM|nr:glycosyltransferase family 4 protein [Tatumella morbirosei]KGD72194.1 hypothetical protein HA49_15690 [Tatumella morbirosei]
MKKICYFINSDWYFDLHWLERAMSAKNDGFEVCVITRFHGDRFLKKFTELGVHCFPLPLKERSYNVFGFVYFSVETFRILNNLKPSLIHAVTIKPIIVGGLYSKIFSKPFVANVVGLGRVFKPVSWSGKVIKKSVCELYSYIFSNKKSRIIFEHKDDFSVFTQYVRFNSQQAAVIDGCGVDTELYNYSVEQYYEQPVVLFASRMLHNKGLSALINIKKSLAAAGSPFRLLVAGILVDDDPDAIKKADIERWVKEGSIEWLGTRNDIDSLISQVNVVALPTLYPEGVPRILIESASKGRACIAYDSGGCKSIIINGYNGYLIPKGDEDAFCLHLRKLLDNKDLREVMGINGRNLVIEKFSSSEVIAKTIKIYNTVSD